MGNLEHIKTIVIAAMANRSFDHVLGAASAAAVGIGRI